jgi:hypothetical protein
MLVDIANNLTKNHTKMVIKMDKLSEKISNEEDKIEDELFELLDTMNGNDFHKFYDSLPLSSLKYDIFSRYKGVFFR